MQLFSSIAHDKYAVRRLICSLSLTLTYMHLIPKTMSKVPKCNILRTEHSQCAGFAFLFWLWKCNELFKLAQHPNHNTMHRAKMLLYSSHREKEQETSRQRENVNNSVFFCVFPCEVCSFAYILAQLRFVRQEWLRDEYLFECLSLFIQFECCWLLNKN